jgi:hypothetical protein
MRIVLNIPDPVAEQVVETFARAHGWRSQQAHGDIGAFAGQRLIDTIMSVLRAQRGEEAAAVARQEAVALVDQHVVITLNGEP